MNEAQNTEPRVSLNAERRGFECTTSLPSRPARLAALALVAMFGGSGCVHQLEPQVPSRDLPRELEAEALRQAPAEGQGTVVLDAVGAPATVHTVGGLDPEPREICRTPCVAQVATGEHRLVFRRGDSEDEVTLTVGSQPLAYRRSLSYDSGERRDYYGLAIAGLTFGGFFGPIIDPLTSMDGNIDEADVGLIVGGVLGGVVLTAGIVGLVLAIVDPRRVREGASTEWQLDGS